MNSILSVLGTPPGLMAYHLVALFALEAVTGIAWEESRRMRRREYAVMARGFAALLAMRVLWMILEVLRWRGLLSPDLSGWLWPPLSDLFLALSWGMLVLAFLPVLISGQDSKRIPLIAWSGVALCLILFVASALFWREAYPLNAIGYGSHWASYLLPGFRLLVLAAIIAAVIVHAVEQRIWLTSAFVLLLLGQVAALVQRHLFGVEWGAAWTSIADLAALPLLVLTVHQSIVADLYSYGQEFKTVSEESLRQTRELLFLLETSKATMTSLDLNRVLESIVDNVALALNADQGAIALFDREEEDKLYIVATYDPLQGNRAAAFPETRLDSDASPAMPGGAAAALSLEEHPILRQALQRQQPILSNNIEGTESFQELFRLLGSNRTGPLIVQPLVSHERVLGFILVGNARSERPFSQNDGNLCQALANQVSTAVDNARLYHDVEAQTQRLREMLQLEEIESSKNQAILESIADGVVVSDAQDKVVLVNAAATKILGMPRESLLNSSIAKLYPDLPISVQSGQQTLLQAMTANQDRQAFQTVASIRERTVSASLAPVRSNQAEMTGVVAVFRDITKESTAERAKSDFVGTVSHELRTPMTSIRGYVDLLAGEVVGPLNPTQHKFMEKIRYNTARMVEMVNDLIDVSEIGPTGVEINAQQVNVAEIVASAGIAVQELIEQKKMNLTLHIQENLEPITADPNRLKQIVVNLLENACKYTPAAGEVKVSAEMRCDGKGGIGTHDYLLISVSDNGVGIPREEQGRIFDRFYRADNPLSVDAGGAGLGLSIVKALVEAHGGRIWVESQVGSGSTFGVVLPVVAGEAQSPTRLAEAAQEVARTR